MTRLDCLNVCHLEDLFRIRYLQAKLKGAYRLKIQACRCLDVWPWQFMVCSHVYAKKNGSLSFCHYQTTFFQAQKAILDPHPQHGYTKSVFFGFLMVDKTVKFSFDIITFSAIKWSAQIVSRSPYIFCFLSTINILMDGIPTKHDQNEIPCNTVQFTYIEAK